MHSKHYYNQNSHLPKPVHNLINFMDEIVKNAIVNSCRLAASLSSQTMITLAFALPPLEYQKKDDCKDYSQKYSSNKWGSIKLSSTCRCWSRRLLCWCWWLWSRAVCSSWCRWSTAWCCWWWCCTGCWWAFCTICWSSILTRSNWNNKTDQLFAYIY